MGDDETEGFVSHCLYPEIFENVGSFGQAVLDIAQKLYLMKRKWAENVSENFLCTI